MASSGRPVVAVLYGGQSSEHGISCLSAAFVLAHLDRRRYEVVGLGIRPDGRWVLATDDPDRLCVRDGRLPEVAEGPQVVVVPGGYRRLDAPTRPCPLAAVVPVLHGPFGEDGTVQGVLELAGVPYAGSGVLSSAAAMDKQVMKALLLAAGLPVGPFAVLAPGADAATLSLPPGPPWFVKPARAGSSYGISRVGAHAELAEAVALARRYDPKVLVESAVTGRELECAVLADPDGQVRASPPAEVRVVGRPFYDFVAKYLDASTRFDLPAAVPAAVAARVAELAVAAFAALGCESHARVDVFLRPDGEVLLNEVNTAPGLTATSVFPRLWAASGVSPDALVEGLVAGALARGTGLR